MQFNRIRFILLILAILHCLRLQALPAPTNIVFTRTTSTCTALTTQPTNSCLKSQQNFCYNTDEFTDTTKASLAGFTFTAIKTIVDLPNKDGGIWLCDNTAPTLPVFFVQRCTPIGHNRRDRSNTVEFTLPADAVDRRVVAVSITDDGLTTSGLAAFSLCGQEVYSNTIINTAANPITP